MVSWFETSVGKLKPLGRSSKWLRSSGLQPCSFRRKPNSPYYSHGLMCLYAKMGLHGYNLIQGKNLQFNGLVRYKSTGHLFLATYNIFLKAKDPATNLIQTFRTSVSEEEYCELTLSCKVARPFGESKTRHKGDKIKRVDPVDDFLLGDMMPELPLQNPFQNTERFYLLNKSEIQENNWIRLYLELAVATPHMKSSTDVDLSNLEILKVSLESTQDLEPLSQALCSASNAIFYIRYKDARAKKDVDRIAIVRRLCNEQTGRYILVGQQIPEKDKRAAILFRRRLGFYKPWRLSSSRLHAFKNRTYFQRGHKTTVPGNSANKK